MDGAQNITCPFRVSGHDHGQATARITSMLHWLGMRIPALYREAPGFILARHELLTLGKRWRSSAATHNVSQTQTLAVIIQGHGIHVAFVEVAIDVNPSGSTSSPDCCCVCESSNSSMAALNFGISTGSLFDGDSDSAARNARLKFNLGGYFAELLVTNGVVVAVVLIKCCQGVTHSCVISRIHKDGGIISRIVW